MTPVALTPNTAARLKRLLGDQDGGDGRPAAGVGGRATVLVRCTSATAAGGSGAAAQCYPGVVIDPASGATTQDELGTVWLTVLNGGAKAIRPVSGGVYSALVAGYLAVGGDERPRVFSAAGTGWTMDTYSQTGNADHLSGPAGGGSVSFTHTPITAGGQQVSDVTQVFSEDDATGYTLTIPADSGPVEVTGSALVGVSFSDVYAAPFAPKDVKFVVLASVTDMSGGDGDSAEAQALSGICAPVGGTVTPNLAFCALTGGSVAGVVGNNAIWQRVVPFHRRLATAASARRLAWKLRCLVATHEPVPAGYSFTVNFGIGNWGEGFGYLAYRPL